MVTQSQAHVELAQALMRADLSYSGGALLRGPDVTGGWLFVQHAVMTAYEARQYLSRQLGEAVPLSMWREDMAGAARNAGKYFDDSTRLLPGVVAFFEELLRAIELSFLPADRPAPWFDFLRDDFAVLMFRGLPITTNVGGYFAVGAAPHEVASTEQLGLRVRDLAAGIGQMLAHSGADTQQGHQGPLPFKDEEFDWWDGRSSRSLRAVFGGCLRPAMAAALMTVQGAALTANELARTTCCPDCQFAAFKHRLIVTYQSLASLDQLNKSDVSVGAVGRRYLGEALGDDGGAAVILSRKFRALRNGLLHLGLSDVPLDSMGRLAMDEVVLHYTGAASVAVVVTQVDDALAHVADTLIKWCLSAAEEGGLATTLRKP